MTGTARAGMGTLIDTLRSLCLAGTNDYTLGTHVYFSSGHIQEVLDRYQTRIINCELTEVPKHAGGGSVEYYEFQAGFPNWESGTARFVIEDSTGADIAGTLYDADYANGVITFTADQQGSARYLSGYVYDMNAAAADLWRMKASHYSMGCNFRTDNMQVDRGRLIDNCLTMAKDYASRAGARVLTLGRDDSTIFGEL